MTRVGTEYEVFELAKMRIESPTLPAGRDASGVMNTGASVPTKPAGAAPLNCALMGQPRIAGLLVKPYPAVWMSR